MTTTSAPTQATPSPGRRVLVISLAIVAALVAAFFVFANFYTEFLWFNQLGYASVLTTQWIARAVMFTVGFLGMAVPVWAAIQLAYRLRPVYARLSSQLDRYQEAIEPLRRLAMWGIPIFFGLFAGLSSGSQWQIAWMWFNGTATNVKDPQFGLDTGFYMFAMPFYTAVVGFASAVVLITLLVTAFVSYLYGSVRAGQGELRISKAARIQIAITAGLYVLLQAVSLWLDRYATLYDSNEAAGSSGVRSAITVTGPTYTGANAVIPGQTILAIIAVLVAVLFFVTAVVGRWRFPIVGTALLIVTALVVGIGVPWGVTTFQVQPNQLRLEAEYYQRNIDSTKAAFGVDSMEKQEFSAKTDVEPGQLRADAETTASIRIMDPAIIGPAVNQVEQYRDYYKFQPVLDVDRYNINGKSQDVVVAARELNLRQDAAWQNRAVVYTHGYGLVAAAGNQRTNDGSPRFLERGMPTSGVLSKLENFEPRIYFGENSPEYSIVGAPKGSEPIEMDYPRGDDGAGETKNTFNGDGGPRIGGFFNKLLYALKFGSEQIIFSDYVNDESQILYDRKPVDRVQKVAPYLRTDSDPYPTVVDGRMVWVVDGYTTSNNYPYSTGVNLSATAAEQQQNGVTPFDQVNYMRNAVKATVDAYDGKVTLYAWDDKDPVLQTWQKIFPSTLKSYKDMSADLMSHVRYPTDLFKVQRSVLGIYHVDSAQSFFQGDNVWVTPNDPNGGDNKLQPPYYLTMKMPGQQEPTYSMFTSFIPRASEAGSSRNVLTGYLAVDSDAGAEAGKKAGGYGKLRMLVMDADTTVPGPGQVKNQFDGDTDVSSFLNLLSQQRSQVINGNLLTLPVGGGLLYVQPVYVQSSGDTRLPRVQKVLASFGDKVAFENTLSDALDSLFGGDSGASTGDSDVQGVDPSTSDPNKAPESEEANTNPSATPSPSPSPSQTSPATQPSTGDRDALLKQAKDAFDQKKSALDGGDMVAYAEADKKLTQILEKLLAQGN